MNFVRSALNKKSVLIFLAVFIILLFIKGPLHLIPKAEAQFSSPVVTASTATSVNFTASAKTQPTETYLLDIGKSIFHLSISGSITLNGEASLARVVLIDSDNLEYLVYEAYPLIAEDSSLSFSNACDETCVLPPVIPPLSLRLEVESSTININNLSFTDNFDQLSTEVKSIGLFSARAELKTTKDNVKIQKMNQQIKAKGMQWTAGETSVSKMTYGQKKKII